VLQLLIHNQLSAPIFQNMWKYSWFKSGYTLERPDTFTNVNQTLFPNTMNECDIDECVNFHLLKCSHCRKFLCMQHFFEDYHYHDIESNDDGFVNDVDLM